MKKEIEKQIIELLWDSLKKDKENKEWKQTGWGSKSKEGLIECIKKITEYKN